jgi:hypothetical protein
LPVDIFNAKSLQYTRDRDGYLLYSVGENGVDDSGSHAMWEILSGRHLNSSEQAPATPIPTGAVV